MTIFGGWGGRYDEELSSKIDGLLSGQKSRKDKVEEFIEKDLGVDPLKIPYKPNIARLRGNEIGVQRSAATVEWHGNSLGLKTVTICDGTLVCPTCNGSDYCDGTDQDEKKVGLMYCYDCGDNGVKNPYFKPDYNRTDITEHDKDGDWNDLERVWNALRDEYGYSFKKTVASWGDMESGYESLTKKVDPSVRKLKTGQTVRLHRHVIDGDDEYVYAKVGGLFSDTDVCILPSLKPIPKNELANWRVVEVL